MCKSSAKITNVGYRREGMLETKIPRRLTQQYSSYRGQKKSQNFSKKKSHKLKKKKNLKNFKTKSQIFWKNSLKNLKKNKHIKNIIVIINIIKNKI